MEYPFKDLLPLDEVLAREGYYKDWTHLDPEVFYSLTQISEYIKTKGYGVDVRLLIAQLAEHFGLKTTQVVDLANSLSTKHNALKDQFDVVIRDATSGADWGGEIVLARGGKATLGQRLDETTAQLAQNTYRVGSAQPFKTIKSAYDEWVADGRPEPSVIDIWPGTYKEFVVGGANNNIKFKAHHGLGSVIWISDSGYYPDAPFTGGPGGKELVFEDLIIKATHDGTPGWSSTTGGMYALHIDYPNSTGKTIIRRCILISHQDAALGSGTRKDQEIHLYDVELYSTAEFSVAGAPGVNHGALFYHTASDLNQTGQKLVMHNVYAHSINGPGINLNSNSTGDVPVEIEAINVISRSDEFEKYTGTVYENRLTFANENSMMKLSEDNKLNNSSKLNAPVKGARSNTGLLTFNRDLTQTGTQTIAYDSNREIDLILFKMGIDGRNVYSDGFYRAGIANVTYNEETTSAKYSYTGKVLAISQDALANRTIGEVTSIADGVITLNWTHIGNGATGNGVGNIIVFYKN